MFKVISDIMAHWYEMWNTIVIANSFCTGKKWSVHSSLISNLRIKCLCNLLQLEQCNVMFKVISHIMPHWYDLWNTIVIAINFCKLISNIMAHWYEIEIQFLLLLHWKKMICAFMFIMSNHYEIKCLSYLLQLEPCYVESDYDLWNTIVIEINFCIAKKMICALMFIISNH